MTTRTSQQHDWMFFREHRNGNNTTDTYDFCERCGAIRARYFWKDKDGASHQADPFYFGIGIESGTVNQPLCIAPTPAPGEPTEAEIEAGAKALHERTVATDRPFDETAERHQIRCRRDAKAVLDAARSARATEAGETR